MTTLYQLSPVEDTLALIAVPVKFALIVVALQADLGPAVSLVLKRPMYRTPGLLVGVRVGVLVAAGVAVRVGVPVLAGGSVRVGVLVTPTVDVRVGVLVAPVVGHAPP